MPANASPLTIVSSIRVFRGRVFAFGPGKAALLEHIGRTGSISEAAKAMEMSYMKAWKLVKRMERGFAEPLVLKTRGGSARGGATISPTGRKVLALYRAMETASQAAVRRSTARFTRLLK
jgi:molybdate transport system regulatory protein